MLSTSSAHTLTRLVARLRRVLVAAAALALASGAALADERSLQRAEELVDAERHAEALLLLRPLEEQLAGDPRYDYLLGVALLETGSPAEASFALRRATLQAPALAGARIDLARALAAIGDLDEAQAMLERLRTQDPPPAARAAIDTTLAQIGERRAPRTSHRFGFGARVGYDSNANSATALERFLGFDLVDFSREASSPFMEISGGASLVRPLRGGLSLDAGLDLRLRHNPDADFVDSTTVDGVVALRQETARSVRLARLEAYHQRVDGELNSQGITLAGAWEWRLAQRLRVSVTGRAGRLGFGDALRVRDADRLLLGATAVYGFDADGRAEVSASLVVGREDADDAESRYDRDLTGLRLAAGYAFTPRLRTVFSASVLESDYDDIFFEQEFEAPRSDTLLQTAVVLQWLVAPQWLMTTSVAYADNDTDVGIFAYDRVVTSLGFNRVWR